MEHRQHHLTTVEALRAAGALEQKKKCRLKRRRCSPFSKAQAAEVLRRQCRRLEEEPRHRWSLYRGNYLKARVRVCVCACARVRACRVREACDARVQCARRARAVAVRRARCLRGGRDGWAFTERHTSQALAMPGPAVHRTRAADFSAALMRESRTFLPVGWVRGLPRVLDLPATLPVSPVVALSSPICRPACPAQGWGQVWV